MKNSYLIFLFLCCLVHSAGAQSGKPVELPKKPHLIIGAGVALQWFDNPSRSGAIQVEIPVGLYQHLGIQFNRIYSGADNDYYYNSTIAEGSYDIGFYGKYFLHGRFTGRKSGFYIGPEIRFGLRKYSTLQYNPMSPNQFDEVIENHKTSKVMLRWGMQWHFGRHVIFEIAIPTGFENQRYPNIFGNNREISNNSMVLLPTMMFGFAF